MKTQIGNATKSPLHGITGRVFDVTIVLAGLALLTATNAGAFGRGGGGFGGGG